MRRTHKHSAIFDFLKKCSLRIFTTAGLTFAGVVVGPILAGQSTPAMATTVTSQVSVGTNSSCVSWSNGNVECWGTDGGFPSNSYSPVPVPSLSTARSVSAGYAFACAVLSNGRIECWGSNSNGGLGNGSTTNSPTPVPVSNITTATSVSTAALDNDACATLSNGSVECWGQGEAGQLGNGSTSDSSVPVTVSNISTATSVSVGDNTACATLSTGTVKCWGGGGYGVLGNGGAPQSSIPVTVSNISTATSVGVGQNTACATLSNGTVDCWGLNGGSIGSLGDNDGTSLDSTVPVAFSNISTATSVSVGISSACAILGSGGVECWGYGANGQLGNGSTSNAIAPVAVSNLTTATSVSAGNSSTCATLSNGSVDCWGGNNGSSAYSNLPVVLDVPGPTITVQDPQNNLQTNNPQPTFSWLTSDVGGPGTDSQAVLINGVQVASGLSPATSSFRPSAALADGTYTWQIRAIDNIGDVSTTPAESILIDTTSPTMPTQQSPSTGSLSNTAQPNFNWTASTDLGSGIANYSVVVDGSEIGNVAPNQCISTSCSFNAPTSLGDGAHSWYVTANDKAGNSTTEPSVSFTVAVQPVASISSPTNALTGQSVFFSASGSHDSNSTLTDFSWDFDGSSTYSQDTNSSSTVTHSFSNPGTYTIDLRVTNAAGLVSTAVKTLKVTPAPPGGNVGVSINNADYATSSTAVSLNLVWPAGATSALISNDGGFNDSSTRTVALSPTVSWTLQNLVSGQLTEDVYVRYVADGTSLTTFSDNIVVDYSAPTISEASVTQLAGSVSGALSGKLLSNFRASSKTKLFRYAIKLTAKETKSGISVVSISSKKSGGITLKLKSSKQKGVTSLTKTITAESKTTPKFVRMQSAAGKWSKWVPIKVTNR